MRHERLLDTRTVIRFEESPEKSFPFDFRFGSLRVGIITASSIQNGKRGSNSKFAGGDLEVALQSDPTNHVP